MNKLEIAHTKGYMLITLSSMLIIYFLQRKLFLISKADTYALVFCRGSLTLNLFSCAASLMISNLMRPTSRKMLPISVLRCRLPMQRKNRLTMFKFRSVRHVKLYGSINRFQVFSHF